MGGQGRWCPARALACCWALGSRISSPCFAVLFLLFKNTLFKNTIFKLLSPACLLFTLQVQEKTSCKKTVSKEIPNSTLKPVHHGTRTNGGTPSVGNPVVVGRDADARRAQGLA